jgi:carbamoylphosphate synthase large subunit
MAEPGADCSPIRAEWRKAERSGASATEQALIDALRRARRRSGLPAIIRPSFTLGGTGGGIAYNKAEFIEIVERGIDASPTNEVLIEEIVLGWKEFEMEVVATSATTASSSARSRTSTRWACTPAIRSPSRRR